VQCMACLEPLQYLGFQRFGNKQIHDFVRDEQWLMLISGTAP